MTSTELAAIGVVVPAHNEESSLTGCLSALRVAVRRAGVPTRILVVLDDCSDRSVEICRSFGVETCHIDARNVGQARATGARALMEAAPSHDSLWLASTDADTRVEPDWLRHQVEMARCGVDAVLGVVHLADDVLPAGLRRRFEAHYEKLLCLDGTHRHVHGASLGLRASVYARAGGFPPMRNHEDLALVQSLRSLDRVTIAASQRIAVRTSGRLDARCEQGFGAALQQLVRSNG